MLGEAAVVVSQQTTPYPQHQRGSRPTSAAPGGGGGGTPRASGSRPQSASPRVSGGGGHAAAPRVSASLGSVGSGGGGGGSFGTPRSSSGSGGGGGGGGGTPTQRPFSARPSRPTGPPAALSAPYSLDHDYQTGDCTGLRPTRPTKMTHTGGAAQPRNIRPKSAAALQAVPRSSTSAWDMGATTASTLGNPGDVRKQLAEQLSQRGIKSGQVFGFFDQARLGNVSKRAFREGLEKLQVTGSAEAADALFDELDVKRDGTLDHSELAPAATEQRRQQQRPQSAAVAMVPRPPTVSAVERAARNEGALFAEPESQRRPGSALPAASSAGFRRPTSAPAHRRDTQTNNSGAEAPKQTAAAAYRTWTPGYEPVQRTYAAANAQPPTGTTQTTAGQTTQASAASGPPDAAERAAVFRGGGCTS
jgi:hypothetical protein